MLPFQMVNENHFNRGQNLGKIIALDFFSLGILTYDTDVKMFHHWRIYAFT